MIEDDVLRVEQALGCQLPADYRHILLNYPIRYEKGTADGFVWDHSAKLIERNQELRTSRKNFGDTLEPIPDQFILIGDDGGGWQHLLDITSEPSMVYIMPFESVEQIHQAEDDNGTPLSFNQWYHDYLTELTNDGFDLNDEKPPHSKMDWGCVLLALFVVFLGAIVISLMVAGIESLRGR